MEQQQNFQRRTVRQHNKRKSFFTFKLFIFVALLCVSAWVFTYNILPKENEAKESPAINIKSNNPENQSFDEKNEPLQSGSLALAYDELIQKDNNQLLLINSEHEAPSGITDGFVNVLDYVSTLNANILMNKDALVMLKEMFGSAAGIGYDEFRVTEGYRTYEYQQTLYDSAVDKSYVSPPGRSEHHTGLAADISYSGVNIANSKQGTWLAENSYKYGFILRYPQDKEHITNISYEPWHFRFVGLPHAYFCFENNLCMEEYIDYLKRYKEASIRINRVDYNIYYINDTNRTVEIPLNHSYSVSSDNTGGIIVTVWAD